MLASAVEAERFGHLYVLLDGGVGWRRYRALRSVPLVEHQFQVVGRVVEIDPAFMSADFALSEVALDSINHLAGDHHFYSQVIKRWTFRAPQTLSVKAQKSYRARISTGNLGLSLNSISQLCSYA